MLNTNIFYYGQLTGNDIKFAIRDYLIYLCSRFQLTSCSNVNKEIFSGGGRVYITCLLPLSLLVNPPLQLIDNAATSQFQPTFAISPELEFRAGLTVTF
ncbi:hypothetical protein QUA82_10035 [Microcoleus sp. F8-D3]